MSISQNKVVTIHYTVTDAASNEVIDSSNGGQPMVYLHGHQNIIPGLENALEGKAVGDELKVEVAAADAYGEYSEDRVQQVPIEAFEGVANVEPGMAFTDQTEHGPVSISLLTSKTVSLPLMQTTLFQVKTYTSTLKLKRCVTPVLKN